jgi:hypothetical protein
MKIGDGQLSIDEFMSKFKKLEKYLTAHLKTVKQIQSGIFS